MKKSLYSHKDSMWKKPNPQRPVGAVGSNYVNEANNTCRKHRERWDGPIFNGGSDDDMSFHSTIVTLNTEPNRYNDHSPQRNVIPMRVKSKG